jgi:hypothetical protein
MTLLRKLHIIVMRQYVKRVIGQLRVILCVTIDNKIKLIFTLLNTI